MIIQRYPHSTTIVSNQAPFTDALDWLGFLCSKNYLIELLSTKHGLSTQDSTERAKRIVPYIRIASSYVEQSLYGPKEISFLPAYYAILNLMRVYILLGPKHMDFEKNRRHCASYSIYTKKSLTVSTEIIKIISKGTISLFYESLTGQKITKNEIEIKMGDIFPYVSGIEYEYELATAQKPKICQLDLNFFERGGANKPRIRVIDREEDLKKSELKFLKSFKKHPTEKNIFVGEKIPENINNEEMKIEEASKQVNTFLIYHIRENSFHTPISNRRIMLPQELPIVLLFFYMSSVVRYRPEFLEKIMDTKFWPFLSAARTHSFYTFIILFWSFMHQENYNVRTN